MAEAIEENEDPHPKDDIEGEQPDELDDDAIVEQIEIPPIRPSVTRLIITLVIVVAIILAFRFIRDSGSKDGGRLTSGDGMAYSIGDVISQPFDAVSSMRVEVMGAGTIELFPGASLRVERRKASEGKRFTLLGGRIIMDMPKPDLRVVIAAKQAEVSTNGARLFMELWEEYEDYRLRVGALEGKAAVVTENGEMLAISAGDGIYMSAGAQIHPVTPPVTDWPGKVPRLDNRVFPCLNQQDKPSVAALIRSICRQAGMKDNLPDNHPLERIPAPDDLLKEDAVTAGELLDLLGIRYGFRYGVHKNELKVTFLDAQEHLAAIGEWAIFSSPDISTLGWPESVTGDTFGDTPMNLVGIVRLTDAPLEARVGALVTLMAGRSIIGDEYIGMTYDAEFGVAFETLSPMILMQMAFEDLYMRRDTPVERIVPLLERGNLYTARNYFRHRVWGLPPWADEGTLLKAEASLKGVIYSDDDNAGKLYVALAEGASDTKEMLVWFKKIFFSDDVQLGVEATRHLYRIAIDAPDDVNLKFMSNALKNVLTVGSDGSMILALDGLRALAGRIGRDGHLMILVDRTPTTTTSALTRHAAFTMGLLLKLHFEPEDEQRVSKIIARLEDTKSDKGKVILWVLGIGDGVKTSTGLVRSDIVNALAVRIGKISEPGERLWMLRLLRVQRAELEGTVGLGWVRGPAADALTDVLSSKDASYLVEAILSLGLTDPAPVEPPGEPGAMRTMVGKKFVAFASHTDPRLRFLAARYLTNNKPPEGNDALTVLAGDEYPAIAKEAWGGLRNK